MAVINGSMPENIRKASREMDGDNNYIATMDINGVSVTSVAVPDQNLATGALTFTTSETENFKINYINFNFSSAVSQTITITKTTGIANKDEILEVQELTANTSARFVSIANTVINVDNGEQLKIQVSNSGTPAITCYTTLSIQEV